MLKRHEPWMHNFFNRFVYETFFEIVLCTLISIVNYEALGNENKSERFLAILLIVLSVSFMVYIVFLYNTPLFEKTWNL